MTPPQSLVSAWFGSAFVQLHPLLQRLHLEGGRLEGPVTVRLGRGPGRWLGGAMAAGLGVPVPDPGNRLTVDIHSDAEVLHWNRSFNGRATFRSEFAPHGRYPEGHWVERIGKLRVAMTVEIVDGGWHWRTGRARLGALPWPRWLLPRTTAHKRIVAGRYRFVVAFSLPLVGTVLSYQGDLDLAPPAPTPP